MTRLKRLNIRTEPPTATWYDEVSQSLVQLDFDSPVDVYIMPSHEALLVIRLSVGEPNNAVVYRADGSEAGSVKNVPGEACFSEAVFEPDGSVWVISRPRYLGHKIDDEGRVLDSKELR